MSILQAPIKCQQCGYCCENIVINISHSDIIRWVSQQRIDILNEIFFLDNYPKKGTGGFYIRKTALNPKQACPFLRYKNKLSRCSIHNTKPLACKDAPLVYEVFPNCPIFNSKLINEKAKAKIKANQYEDFQLAYANQDPLLAVLTKMRGRY